ncbi:hypothetical protein BJ684DRAFT_1939, partial [Piptocephalis cylindrospora]
EEEEDEYDARIRRTGCYEENDRLQECYLAKHDWRACKQEMEAFRTCFSRHQSKKNNE